MSTPTLTVERCEEIAERAKRHGTPEQRQIAILAARALRAEKMCAQPVGPLGAPDYELGMETERNAILAILRGEVAP